MQWREGNIAATTRIMVLVSIFLNHNLVSSWVVFLIRIMVMVSIFPNLNFDLKFSWVVEVVLFLCMVHMMEITRFSQCLLSITLTDLFRSCFKVQAFNTLQSKSRKPHIVLLTVM